LDYLQFTSYIFFGDLYMKAFFTFIVFITIQTTCFAVEQPNDAPSEIAPFIEPKTYIGDWKTADLNGDGLNDYIVVLKEQTKAPYDPLRATKPPVVLIVIRQPDHTLKLDKRSDRAICSKCGDLAPGKHNGLLQVTASKRTFSISLQVAGGPRWFYDDTFVFGYSKRDHTWQLVRIETNQTRVDDDNPPTDIRTPPKDFGKIDFSDFNPDDFDPGR